MRGFSTASGQRQQRPEEAVLASCAAAKTTIFNRPRYWATFLRPQLVSSVMATVPLISSLACRVGTLFSLPASSSSATSALLELLSAPFSMV